MGCYFDGRQNSPIQLQGNVWQSNRRATNWIIEDDKALNKFKQREKKQ